MTMRRYQAILSAALALVFALASCTRPPATTPPRGLNLSREEATLAFNDAECKLTIKAKVAWTLTVTSGGDWITPDISDGEAGSTRIVTFALSENPNDVQRLGTVEIRGEGESEPYGFTIVQNAENVLSGVNEWIYDQMKGWYYWNGAVKSAPAPSNSLGYEEFLETLITELPWKSVQDTSNDEDPPTIDGNYVTDDYDNLVKPLRRNQIYSYIEQLPASTRAEDNTETTFGFDIEPVTMNSRGVHWLLVRWVRPGSPADKAGIRRGTWITEFNGAEMFRKDYETFWNRLHKLAGGTTLNFSALTDATDANSKTPYTLTAAPTIITPIFKNKIMTSPKGKKVAYLVYNEFEPGKGDEFDNELREVFAGFKAGGVTELVLDLRYNLGGYVRSCQLLTSLAAKVGSNDVFVKMLRNKNIAEVYPVRIDNPETEHFFNEKNSLGLGKIYVIETQNSASASEMVINSLEGVGIEVVHIGTRTNGKNVGMDLREYKKAGEPDYEMWPITFKVLNAKDFTNYANGFQPDYYKNEFWDITEEQGSGEILDFGDPKERLLEAALTLIDGGEVGHDPKPGTRAAAGGPQLEPALVDSRRGGAKYIPGEQP
jgi:C-terminal processing protease CtpA/Prc